MKFSASSDLRVINRQIIIEGPESQQVCIGCKATLHCVLSDTSSEFTKVFWKKDNNDVETDDRININPSTNQLQIKDAKFEDSGKNYLNYKQRLKLRQII